MTPRVIFASLGLAVLAACQPAVPDSGSGVGFDNSIEAQRQREAALASSTISVPPPSPVNAAPLGSTGGLVDNSPATTAAETQRVLDATRPAPLGYAALNSGVEPLQASPSNPAPVAVDTAGISDENNFDAVAERQTIQSDAARIAQNRAQYQVIQPEALPDRTDDGGPNIVKYALQTSHPRGQRQYARSGFSSQAKFARNCAAYPSPDQAQIDFLSRGGPERDRKGLDPDGDGYACDWDPTPFRQAAISE